MKKAAKEPGSVDLKTEKAQAEATSQPKKPRAKRTTALDTPKKSKKAKAAKAKETPPEEPVQEVPAAAENAKATESGAESVKLAAEGVPDPGDTEGAKPSGSGEGVPKSEGAGQEPEPKKRTRAKRPATTTDDVAAAWKTQETKNKSTVFRISDMCFTVT